MWFQRGYLNFETRLDSVSLANGSRLGERRHLAELPKRLLILIVST
jgi:hypothetical protein